MSGKEPVHHQMVLLWDIDDAVSIILEQTTLFVIATISTEEIDFITTCEKETPPNHTYRGNVQARYATVDEMNVS